MNYVILIILKLPTVTIVELNKFRQVTTCFARIVTDLTISPHYKYSGFKINSLKRLLYPKHEGQETVLVILHDQCGSTSVAQPRIFFVCSCFEGIGRATVKLLAKCGANIVALSRTKSDLDSLKTEVSF